MNNCIFLIQFTLRHYSEEELFFFLIRGVTWPRKSPNNKTNQQDLPSQKVPQKSPPKKQHVSQSFTHNLCFCWALVLVSIWDGGLAALRTHIRLIDQSLINPRHRIRLLGDSSPWLPLGTRCKKEENLPPNSPLTQDFLFGQGFWALRLIAGPRPPQTGARSSTHPVPVHHRQSIGGDKGIMNDELLRQTDFVISITEAV